MNLKHLSDVELQQKLQETRDEAEKTTDNNERYRLWDLEEEIELLLGERMAQQSRHRRHEKAKLKYAKDIEVMKQSDNEIVKEIASLLEDLLENENTAVILSELEEVIDNFYDNSLKHQNRIRLEGSTLLWILITYKKYYVIFYSDLANLLYANFTAREKQDLDERMLLLEIDLMSEEKLQAAPVVLTVDINNQIKLQAYNPPQDLLADLREIILFRLEHNAIRLGNITIKAADRSSNTH